MNLIQGSTDYRIEVVIDYQNGEQITQQELAEATSIKLAYKWFVFDADEVDPDADPVTYEGEWTASGYGLTTDNEPYVFYNATEDDIVPSDASRLLGRVVITDVDGLVSKSQMFEIQVLPDELA